MAELPPAAQQLLIQLQTFQQQYQTIALQKEGLTIQKIDIEKALEELQKASETEEVFKAAGPILVKSTKSALLKELKEKKQLIETRLKALEPQEKKIKEKIKDVQNKLQSFLKS